MGKRRSARVLALRLLFQMDVGNAPLHDVRAALRLLDAMDQPDLVLPDKVLEILGRARRMEPLF